MGKGIVILGIESSCDDTSASIIVDGVKYSNVVAGQKVHEEYGGVVPELASRAHQQNIIPTVDLAIKEAGITKKDITAVGYTRGPGLLGSLLVGSSFARAFTMGLDIPLIDVNHMQGHILAHFIQEKEEEVAIPEFPFLCLTVSGGHTQIVLVKDHFDMEVIGETVDDAAGEAFDKVAKIMDLPYPGGPLIDKYAREGNPNAFEFPPTRMQGLNFSFSGFKTSFLYFLRKEIAKEPDFIQNNLNDLCASAQHYIISTLMGKLKRASNETGIKRIAIAGGVSANSGLRAALNEKQQKSGWKVFLPQFEYCTDNAAMIAITAYYKYLKGDFSTEYKAPSARMKL